MKCQKETLVSDSWKLERMSEAVVDDRRGFSLVVLEVMLRESGSAISPGALQCSSSWRLVWKERNSLKRSSQPVKLFELPCRKPVGPVPDRLAHVFAWIDGNVVQVRRGGGVCEFVAKAR